MKPRLPRWLLLLAALLLIASLVAALALRDVLRDAIVTPLAYVAWLAGLVLGSIPQSTYWILLVVVGTAVAWRSLGGRRALFGRREKAIVVPDSAAPSRLRSQLDLLSQLGTSAFARERAAFELRGLMVALLAHEERRSVEEIEQRVRNGSLAPPPEIRALLLDWQNWLAVEPERVVDSLWLRARRRFGVRQLPARQTAALNAKITRAIDYMEQQLK
jgi:hypothetical protein